MKLGLLGFPIEHSLSPKIYNELLGSELTSYELFSYPNKKDVPKLSFFAENLDGLNITTPYKEHFLSEVIIESELVQKIGAVNTLAFSNEKIFATNTDLLAVRKILTNYHLAYPKLGIQLLGNGAMARLTVLVAQELGLPLTHYQRETHGDLTSIDLSQKVWNSGTQGLIINSCSRSFIFSGKVQGDEIFWDYNYSFLPHQNTLPLMVKTYCDGRSLLEEQAKAAVKFWQEVTPKLK